MHIESTGDAFMFFDGVEHFEGVANFDKHVNLLVGPNASGKTTMLRAIERAWNSDDCFSLGDRPPVQLDAETDFDQDEAYSCSLILSRDLAKPGEVAFWYIPATRVNLPIQDLIDGSIGNVNPMQVDAPLAALFDTTSGVFNAHYVEPAVEWLRDGGRVKGTRVFELIGTEFSIPTNDPTLIGSQQSQFREALAAGFSCAKRICSEVIRGDAPRSYVEFSEGKQEAGQGNIVHYGMGVPISADSMDVPLYAGALSSGTQGTLLWVWALALKIANHYDWAEGWQHKPAILLIDEIENHLHPTWQRRVIPALLEHFPGLQIFATTHSPFVVAGLKAGQVHLLKRDEDGRITATATIGDVIGWTADEILRNMMGVDDPTDDVTAAAAQELRDLRNSAAGDTQEAEEKRQQRIQELRQLVNRDLLAGGPMAAQRELFEEHLTEILEEHRRSESLNQDGG